MIPMTEIEKLKDGVYEKVMSRRFAEVLKEALAEDQVCVQKRKMWMLRKPWAISLRICSG